MEQNRPNSYGPHLPGAFADLEISTLLNGFEAGSSIVDGLLDLPMPESDDHTPALWQAAVARRMERRLAETMRAIIEGEPERKRA